MQEISITPGIFYNDTHNSCAKAKEARGLNVGHQLKCLYLLETGLKDSKSEESSALLFSNLRKVIYINLSSNILCPCGVLFDTILFPG